MTNFLLPMLIGAALLVFTRMRSHRIYLYKRAISLEMVAVTLVGFGVGGAVPSAFDMSLTLQWYFAIGIGATYWAMSRQFEKKHRMIAAKQAASAHELESRPAA